MENEVQKNPKMLEKLEPWLNYLQSNKFRTNIHWLIYVFVPLALFILLVVLQQHTLAGQLGEWAWQILILVLFIKPIVKIISRRELMWLLTYRRELGILCFYLAFSHLATIIFLLKGYQVTNYLGLNNFMLYGAIAGIILIFLYLSSNNFAMRLLKKNWKRLQSFSYLLLPLISIHQILVEIELEDTFGLIALNIIFIVLKILEYKKITLKFKQI
jgi:DMSO/TMAO reductase YedYZ heme-binding membrane subunit